MLEVKDTKIERLKNGIRRVLNEGPGAITIQEAMYSYETEGTRFVVSDGQLIGIERCTQ